MASLRKSYIRHALARLAGAAVTGPDLAFLAEETKTTPAFVQSALAERGVAVKPVGSAAQGVN
jgi:hypothetical protein